MYVCLDVWMFFWLPGCMPVWLMQRLSSMFDLWKIYTLCAHYGAMLFPSACMPYQTYPLTLLAPSVPTNCLLTRLCRFALMHVQINFSHLIDFTLPAHVSLDAHLDRIVMDQMQATERLQHPGSGASVAVAAALPQASKHGDGCGKQQSHLPESSKRVTGDTRSGRGASSGDSSDRGRYSRSRSRDHRHLGKSSSKDRTKRGRSRSMDRRKRDRSSSIGRSKRVRSSSRGCDSPRAPERSRPDSSMHVTRERSGNVSQPYTRHTPPLLPKVRSQQGMLHALWDAPLSLCDMCIVFPLCHMLVPECNAMCLVCHVRDGVLHPVYLVYHG